MPTSEGDVHANLGRPQEGGCAAERSGTLGGGLDVVAVRGEAARSPQAHRTAPYRPRCSLDQRTAGQYRWRDLCRETCRNEFLVSPP